MNVDASRVGGLAGIGCSPSIPAGASGEAIGPPSSHGLRDPRGQPWRRSRGGCPGDFTMARIPVVLPASTAARTLCAFQQGPHRHTTLHVPSTRRSRIKRHPAELVSVRSGLASGE
jgi:hypothetical protein